MASITVRIDDDVKKQAESLFHKLGFNISGVINSLFRQAIKEQSIPFPVKTAKEIKYDEYFNEYNMKILEESLAQLKAGQVIVKTIEELEAMENE